MTDKSSGSTATGERLLQLLTRLDEHALHCRKVQSENEDKGLNNTADIFRVMANCHEADADLLRDVLSARSETTQKPIAWRWRVVSTDKIPWLYATEKPNNLNKEMFWEVEPLFASSALSATPRNEIIEECAKVAERLLTSWEDKVYGTLLAQELRDMKNAAPQAAGATMNASELKSALLDLYTLCTEMGWHAPDNRYHTITRAAELIK